MVPSGGPEVDWAQIRPASLAPIGSNKENNPILHLDEAGLCDLADRFSRRLEKSVNISPWGLMDYRSLIPYPMVILRELERSPIPAGFLLPKLESAITQVNRLCGYETFSMPSGLLVLLPFYYSELLILDRKGRLSKSSLLALANNGSSEIRCYMADILWILRSTISPDVVYELARKNVIRPLAYNEGYVALLGYMARQDSELARKAASLLASQEVTENLIGVCENDIPGIVESREASLDDWLGRFMEELKRETT